ncbi:MAG: phospho-N-acetylmuramoyl-pentapeptide-transferase, partial [Desulfovibrionaceae bacterium]|nr:phospho-N-acetylmuramoyl-pentapeptide-transferase [Desulfovibrionaceae bacterium]
MFYNLLTPLASEWTVFNVFRYLSFRSVAALITALVISILVGPRFIAWLRRLKC